MRAFYSISQIEYATALNYLGANDKANEVSSFPS